MEWYIKVLSNYFVFEGRARRQEFWMFVLVNLFIVIGIGIVENMVGLAGSLTGLYNLAVLIPTLAVSARRLHDTDRTAWWLLLNLLPVLGTLVLLLFYCLDGDPHDNEYGADPKGAGD